MDKNFLPVGKHWGLNIIHVPMNDAGAFTGGGWKFVWHTTEGADFQGALNTLRGKDAAPHLVIDIAKGRVAQCIPFDRAARALQHTLPEETNHANCIQVEICGYTDPPQGDTHNPLYIPNWKVGMYEHLAALTALTEHRRKIVRRAPISFDHPRRLTGPGFVRATGHLGHVHVPGNTHTDPTRMNIGSLLRHIPIVEKRYA